MSWARIRLLAQQAKQISTLTRDQQIKAEFRSINEKVLLTKELRCLLLEKKSLLPQRYQLPASWLFSDVLKCENVRELQELANMPEVANMRESLLAKPKK